MKPTKEEEWIIARDWISRHKDAPEILKRVTREKAARADRQIPKQEVRPKPLNKALKERLEAKAERLCIRIVKARDKDKNGGSYCISCGAYGLDHQWGHFIKQALCPFLRFSPMNSAMQCETCNLLLDGNSAGFLKGINKREGGPSAAALLIVEAQENKRWIPTIENLEKKIEELEDMEIINANGA